ncbi:54S ribosomal protein L49 [Colletotrichum orbiculare MAFF 240422]|uniref:Large ribosomal subunit protein bL21m n=1 Tax=Colletotrichum orbiculare (strain 104-T / ATCC 96160 / CBS 514.97 / LARS 414 / MAFF 240422) TaxID=1213857 RepID=N4VIM0_COLOR|nr:54S ribosomal protein L49 [Colletotrichum orbiculare MAFF 240422]
MSRSLLRSVQELRTLLSARLPPTFLLPTQTRRFNSTTPIVEPAASHNAPVVPTKTAAPQPSIAQNAAAAAAATAAPAAVITPAAATNPSPSAPQPISPEVKAVLPLLAAQPNYYITIHIHGRPYLVTPGDSVRLPFKMPGVVPGDVLRLNRASVLGSRDYTLKGAPFIDERLYECRAIVTGTESEPMRFKEKTKRRNRKVKTVKSKHRYTILAISELKVKEATD